MTTNNNSAITLEPSTVFTIHKRAGELKTCRLVRKPEDIPEFLTEVKKDENGNPIEPAVTILDDNTVRMIAVEGPADRTFPFFLKWEKTEKKACGYGAWPKDNGWTTLDVTEDGRCFDKAADDASMPRYKACKLVFPLPLYFGTKQGISGRNNHVWVQTSWGETREHQVPADNTCEAILIEYEDGHCNILTLSEPSAGDYYVEVEGRDVGKLVDLV